MARVLRLVICGKEVRRSKQTMMSHVLIRSLLITASAMVTVEASAFFGPLEVLRSDVESLVEADKTYNLDDIVNSQMDKINFFTYNQAGRTFYYNGNGNVPKLTPANVQEAVKNAVLKGDPDVIVLCQQEASANLVTNWESVTANKTSKQFTYMADDLQNRYEEEFKGYKVISRQHRTGVAGSESLALAQSVLAKTGRVTHNGGQYSKSLSRWHGINLKGVLFDEFTTASSRRVTTACAHLDTKAAESDAEKAIETFKEYEKSKDNTETPSDVFVLLGDINMRKAWPLQPSSKAQGEEDEDLYRRIKLTCEQGGCAVNPNTDKWKLTDKNGNSLGQIACRGGLTKYRDRFDKMLQTSDATMIMDQKVDLLTVSPQGVNSGLDGMSSIGHLMCDPENRPFTYKVNEKCQNIDYLTAIGKGTEDTDSFFKSAAARAAALKCFAAKDDSEKSLCARKHGGAFNGGVLDRVCARTLSDTVTAKFASSETVIAAADGGASDHVPTLARMILSTPFRVVDGVEPETMKRW